MKRFLCKLCRRAVVDFGGWARCAGECRPPTVTRAGYDRGCRTESWTAQIYEPDAPAQRFPAPCDRRHMRRLRRPLLKAAHADALPYQAGLVALSFSLSSPFRYQAVMSEISLSSCPRFTA